MLQFLSQSMSASCQAGDERETTTNELLASTEQKKIVKEASDCAASLMSEAEALLADNKFSDAQAKYTAAAKQFGIAHNVDGQTQANKMAADAGMKDEFRHLQG